MIKLPERLRNLRRSGKNYLLPVLIRRGTFIVIGIALNSAFGRGALDGAERRREGRQFWSLVFHDSHLLSLLRLSYTAA